MKRWIALLLVAALLIVGAPAAYAQMVEEAPLEPQYICFNHIWSEWLEEYSRAGYTLDPWNNECYFIYTHLMRVCTRCGQLERTVDVVIFEHIWASCGLDLQCQRCSIVRTTRE